MAMFFAILKHVSYSNLQGLRCSNMETDSLAIDLIKPVERGHAKFNDLVLPPLHKHLVESLVSSHSTEPHHGPDLQRGKGNIFVLHYEFAD